MNDIYEYEVQIEWINIFSLSFGLKSFSPVLKAWKKRDNVSQKLIQECSLEWTEKK
jgi:hypothetical protein